MVSGTKTRVCSRIFIEYFTNLNSSGMTQRYQVMLSRVSVVVISRMASESMEDPEYIKYLLDPKKKYDCYFIVGNGKDNTPVVSRLHTVWNRWPHCLQIYKINFIGYQIQNRNMYV